MHRDIEVGDYLLAITLDRLFDPVASDKVVGYTVRVIVSRPDRRPVRGQMLTETSGILPENGEPIPTVEDALNYGEAWGRSYVDTLSAR